MTFQYFIFICLALSTHGIKLHEHMTKREIETTFNCDHKLVHEVEYEVAPIIHVDRLYNRGQVQRSHSTAHFKAFDRNIFLYLLENDNTFLGSHTPLFTAKRNRRGRSFNGHLDIIYSRTQFPMPENLKLYHDMKNRAAITVYTDEENRAHMYGVIGEDFIVKPVPARLQKEILPMFPQLYQPSLSYKRPNLLSHNPFFTDLFSGNSLFGNVYEPTHHIIIKPKVQVNSAYYDPVDGRWKYLNQQWHNKDSNENDLSNPFLNWKNQWKQPVWPTSTQAPFHWSRVTRKPWHPKTNTFPTRPSPTRDPDIESPSGRMPSEEPPSKNVNLIAEHSDTVYPELLVSIDYETYEFHGHDITELSKYMAAFWNAVDLRFRELSQPQVQLNIAGLIVPETIDSAPYFEGGRVNNKAIVAEGTVREIGKYFSQEEQFPKNMYDIAVAMSHLNLVSFTPNGKFNDGTTGIAMLGGACQVYQGQAAALIRDKGGFNGITTAAHELAHAMGAPHDGDDTRDFPGGPCPWSDGYLMSYQRRDSRGMHWSRCSKLAMSNFFKSNEAQCLRNKPDVGTPYPKILPGKLLSRDEQCRRSLGPGFFSNKDKESDCAVLHCEIYSQERQESLLTTENRPPAEGSYCGEGAICLDAQCVEDPGVL